jgi:hypothetical protein
MQVQVRVILVLSPGSVDVLSLFSELPPDALSFIRYEPELVIYIDTNGTCPPTPLL